MINFALLRCRSRLGLRNTSLFTSWAFALRAGTAVLSLICIAGAQAPAIPEIPDNIPSPQREKFLQRRDALLSQRSQLNARIASQRATCGKVTVGTPLEQSCLASRSQLDAEKSRYGSAVQKLIDDLAAATVTLPAKTSDAATTASSEYWDSLAMVVPVGARQMLAETELAIVAPKPTTIGAPKPEDIDAVRYEMVQKLMECRLKGFQIFIVAASEIGEGAETVLSPPGMGDSKVHSGATEVEALSREQRQLFAEYLTLRSKYGKLIGEPNLEKPGAVYARLLRFGDVNFSVATSDSTARVSSAPACHEEIVTRFEKRWWIIPDRKGNLLRKLDYDLVTHRREVCP